MLKEKTKNNVIKSTVNTIGAGLVSAHKTKSAEAHSNLNSKAGITLIALIITIIVMLILVGVTINVALNGELFNKANNAVTLTQKEIEREELTEIALGAYNPESGIVDQAKLEEEINNSNDFTIPGEQPGGNKLIVDGNKTEQQWKIDLDSAEVSEYKKESHTFALKDFIEKANNQEGSMYTLGAAVFWPMLDGEVSEEFKNGGTVVLENLNGQCVKKYNLSVQSKNPFPDMTVDYLGAMKNNTVLDWLNGLEGKSDCFGFFFTSQDPMSSPEDFYFVCFTDDANALLHILSKEELLETYGDAVFTITI